MSHIEDLRIIRIRKSDKKKISAVSLLISSEFTTQFSSQEEKILKIKNQLATGKSIAFQVLLRDLCIGTIVINLFPKSEIENQLYIYATATKDTLDTVSLKSLGDILRVHGLIPPELIVEFAYIIILPQFRGLGIGSIAWNAYEAYITKKFPSASRLILIRPSDYKLVDYNKVLSYLLNKERRAQGIPLDQWVTVKGLLTPFSELEKVLETEIDLSFDRGVPQMTQFVKTSGYIPIAFSKSFCPVWVKS